MKAKKKPIDETTPETLGVDISARQTVISVTEPKRREAGIKLDDVAQLVDKLKNEAGVL
jgi:electron transfer flavoprotein beta subunit